MARPQAPNYEGRRQLIIDKAAALFSAHGFHGASIADIADACRISKSMIYHYHGAKEDVLFAVMVSYLDRLAITAQQITRSDMSPVQQLTDLIRVFLHLYVDEPDRQRVVLDEVRNLPGDKQAEVICRQRSLIYIVEEILTAVQPVLGESPQRRRVSAMLFFGMINWTHTWFNPQGALTTDELAEMSAKLMLTGLQGMSSGRAI
jgi:AcrR family transcriptional regulator